jgi:hypothetical protein
MAIGEDHVAEAARSSQSAKEHMPDIRTAIAVDNTDYDLTAFDDVLLLDDNKTETIDGRTWFVNSTIPPDLSPYDKTIFLDNDTYLTDSVYEVFDILDQFELAIARTPGHPDDGIEDLPDVWSHYNCGVIAYKNTTGVKDLLEKWDNIYWDLLDEQEDYKDQPAFARALYKSDIRWYELPREYNVRVPRRGKLAGKAKIIHGRHKIGLENIARQLNRTDNLRVFRERSKFLKPAFIVKDRGSFRYHTEVTLSRHGPIMFLKVLFAYVIDRLFGTNLRSTWLDDPSVG